MNPTHLLDRPRLLRRLGAVLHQGHVLIEAPPGCGKSTLPRAFARHTPHAHYLALTPADADLRQLQTRWQTRLQPGALLLLDDAHTLHAAPDTLAWLIAPFIQTRFTAAELAFTPTETAALLRDHIRARDWQARMQGWTAGCCGANAARPR